MDGAERRDTMASNFAPSKTDSIELLRDAVAWANGQNENYWHPSDDAPMPATTVIGVYRAVVRHLGSTIEDVIADELPFKWNEYNVEDQAAINYVRRAFGLRPKR